MQVFHRATKVSETLKQSTLSPLLQRIYAARGVTEPSQIETELTHLHPYTSLSQIDKAVDCLCQVLEHDKHIMVIGDFDADGATSTALLISALIAMGYEKLSYKVPNRFEYGYGLSPELVDAIYPDKPDVLVTVDNGITSMSGVRRAHEYGMRVLITDHHLPGEGLPPAEAIVNPNVPGDLFPSKCLAGVGVVFYVLLALRARLRALGWFEKKGLNEPNMARFLDLVALGTVADVVPLDHNNRILVAQGLKRMRKGQLCPGIKALLDVSGRSLEALVASDLGFAVGPRLNAAGRLDDMSKGIACLLEPDETHAHAMALELDALNRERRAIESNMQTQALEWVEQSVTQQTLTAGLCLYDERWHQGVIGILASRIKDKFHRPVFAFAKVNDTHIKGSGRSIKGLHLRDILTEIHAKDPDVMIQFGGHAMAAGVSLPLAHYERFKTAFAEHVAKHVSEDTLRGVMHTDGPLKKNELTLLTADQLRQAGPWGAGFEEPLFDGEFQVHQQRLVADKHLKLELTLLESQEVIEAIAFNVDLAAWPNTSCTRIRLVYQLDVNEYRGQRSLQLIARYLEAL